MGNILLETLVEEDFGYVKEGRNWGRSEQHSSLVVNEEEQKWYWNSEEMGGDVLSYLIKVRGMNKKSAVTLVNSAKKYISGILREEKNGVFYTPMEKLVDTFWQLGKHNRDYWYNRKLTDKTIDRYRLGFYNGWNLVPLYNSREEFINFQMRRDLPDKAITGWYKEKVWNPILLNSGLLSLVDTIYITEGTLDALLLHQEGIPAVTQTNGANVWSHEWYPLFDNVKRIYYIADNDKAGRIAARRVAQSLGEYRTLIYQFDGKPEKYDTVDFFREGGIAKDFKELVENNSSYLFEIGELSENRTGYRRSYKTLAR